MRCLLCGVQKRHVTSMTVPENDICTRTRITLLGDLSPFRFYFMQRNISDSICADKMVIDLKNSKTF